jgi:hypothetical protein
MSHSPSPSGAHVKSERYGSPAGSGACLGSGGGGLGTAFSAALGAGARFTTGGWTGVATGLVAPPVDRDPAALVALARGWTFLTGSFVAVELAPLVTVVVGGPDESGDSGLVAEAVLVEAGLPGRLTAGTPSCTA